jgi:hypothetical protein
LQKLSYKFVSPDPDLGHRWLLSRACDPAIFLNPLVYTAPATGGSRAPLRMSKELPEQPLLGSSLQICPEASAEFVKKVTKSLTVAACSTNF